MARIALCANVAWNLAHFRAPVIEALVARGDAVLAVAGADDSVGRLRRAGCEVVELAVDSKGANPARDLVLALRLRALYARRRPDVVLNFTIKPVIYGTMAARLAGVPVINTVTGLGTAFMADTWLHAVVDRLYRMTLPGSGPVVFQNGEDMALFRQRGYAAAADCRLVAGSGIDLARFAVAPMPAGPGSAFLMIARLLRDKGVVEFVEAARLVRAALPSARFRLVGPLGVANRTAVAEAELRAWVAEGAVEYLGEADDVRPHIAAADCVVLPSYREGMPRVLLEAAAMGRPLIATDVTGCREVVEDGVNGFLCPARDAAALAESMLRFAALDDGARRAMGQASRALAEARFDVAGVVSTYLGLIDERLASRRPGLYREA